MILHGDALTMLKTLSDESVHCCVTSPPYWGLRDYGTAKWEGGDPECDHKGAPLCSSSSSLAGYTSENIKLRTFAVPMKGVCSKCGAIRIDNQLGLEPTPEEYVAKMVEVFREVRRVLRDDGVLFLNLGDSYYGSSMTGGTKSKKGSAKRMGRMFEKPSNVQHEDAYDTSDKAPADYQESGCLCENLCDVCREVYLRTSRTYDLLVPMLTVSLSGPTRESMGFVNGHSPTSDFSRLGARIFPAIQRLLHCGGRADEQLRAIRESMPDEFSRQLLDLCWQRGNSSACLLCGRSLTDNVQGFAHMSGGFSGQQMHIQNNALHDAQRGHRSQYKDKACGYCNEILTTDTPPNIQPYCTTNKWKNQLKPKDLIGIPWRVAFALQADGWYLRQDIIWCLSGGTLVYAKTQKGEMPMTVKDMARLDPTTVKLWNGERWTQVLGWSKSQRKGDELEIVLRSGERISCTTTHKFPTERGLLEAKDIKVGDCLHRVRLPEPQEPKDCNIDEQAAWLAGLYIAEGSRSGDCIQIAGHAKEEERWRRVQMIAARYGGSATRTINGNMMNIRVYGKIINAIIDYLVTGKTAKDKGFSPVVWQYSNSFISEMLDGYLKGDGHWDDTNQRWRLGFTRNYNLERDLRTACARLGYKITLNMSTTPYNGKHAATFRGEIRYEASTYHNRRNDAEVMEIRKSRCREVYDIGVEDEPHVFALASGLLTHNSKPNPMPESVTDRCTKAHEYLFLLSKNGRYYYDAEAIKEPCRSGLSDIKKMTESLPRIGGKHKILIDPLSKASSTTNIGKKRSVGDPSGRNRRSVWTIATHPYKAAHFATFPPDLIEPCILAGCPEGGMVLDPFFGAGTTGLVCSRLNREYIGIELNGEYVKMAERRIEGDAPLLNVKEVQR
jgi:DNA modification methylase/intein/homing endonuclease